MKQVSILLVFLLISSANFQPIEDIDDKIDSETTQEPQITEAPKHDLLDNKKTEPTLKDSLKLFNLKLQDSLKGIELKNDLLKESRLKGIESIFKGRENIFKGHGLKEKEDSLKETEYGLKAKEDGKGNESDLKEKGGKDVIEKDELVGKEEPSAPTPCTCGVFLSGQFVKSSKEPPKGEPCFTQETEGYFMNNSLGHRQCMNKCIELVIPHLSKSAEIICATAGRDLNREKAFLFIQNQTPVWQNSNMSAGRDFCCKEDKVVKCSLI